MKKLFDTSFIDFENELEYQTSRAKFWKKIACVSVFFSSFFLTFLLVHLVSKLFA